MLKKEKILLTFLIILFNYGCISAQQEQEYFGIVKLNDSSLISYKLNIIENKGAVSGYSVTDIGGDHETKSNITGSYNKKTNILSFREVGIIYTKSEVSDYDFCYIHFEGRLRNIDSKKNISGKFNGQYNDGSTCINGEIALKSIEKIEKRAKRVDKIIQNSKKINDSLKSKVSMVETLDLLKTNILKSNQNLSMFTSSAELKLSIFDAGKVDGDKINVFVNDTILLRNYTVSKKPKHLTIRLNSKLTTIKIRALNVGSISPNTAKVEIIDQKNNISTLTSLKKGEKTSITVIRPE